MNIHRRRQFATSGLTLIEFLVTLAIAAMVGVMVPGLRSLIDRVQANTGANSLLDDLRFARSEAASRGVSVSICGSNDAQHCVTGAGASAWAGGRLVFVGSDATAVGTSANVLRRSPALAANTVVTPTGLSDTISFTARGVVRSGSTALGNATLRICSGSAMGRTITLRTAARPLATTANCP